MRKLIVGLIVVAVAAAAFTIWPFATAWQIHKAVRQRDVPTLEAKVDWPSVRRSLKSSLTESHQFIAELAAAGGEPKLSWWQRLRMRALPFVSDPLIDRYITAQQLPRLYTWQQTIRRKTPSALARTAKPGPLAGTWLAGGRLDRNLAWLRRLEAARFVSPTKLVLEIADRVKPGRRWSATLEFVRLDWRLTELHILTAPTHPTIKAANSR
ncbi:MAG: DUF2939 domain-containing protein [Hyphomicrobiaceae bacterium]